MREAQVPSSSSCKRLLFDRRYGFVIDEWKEASAEALSGGRGMFCILPLATALFNTINVAANSAVKALEKPELLWPDPTHKMKISLTNSDIISTLFRKEKVSLTDVDSNSDM